MKKLLLLIFLATFLSGCQELSTTKLQNPPENLEKIGNLFTWNSVKDIRTYEILVKDVTLTNSEYLLADQIIVVNTNSYDITNLSQNRLLNLTVRCKDNNLYSDYSNEIIINTFVDSDIQYKTTFNINSINDLVVLKDISTVYYIEKDGSAIDKKDYSFLNGYLVLSNRYLKTFSEKVTFNLYTSDGIEKLIIDYMDKSKPSISSNNEIIIHDQDDVFIVFDLCGGEFVEINGSGISSSDYSLDGNVLIIKSEFILNLFSENPDRNSVILSYQLKNGDEIVIGNLFIYRK